jgi:hypothetical protein
MPSPSTKLDPTLPTTADARGNPRRQSGTLVLQSMEDICAKDGRGSHSGVSARITSKRKLVRLMGIEPVKYVFPLRLTD